MYRDGQSVTADQGPYAAATGRWVYRGGERLPATKAVLQGDTLRLEFDGRTAHASYRVTRGQQYLAFQLVDLTCPRLDRIDLLQVDVRGLPQVGQWVNLARDEDFGICLCSGNMATNAEMDRYPDHLQLRATAQKDVGFLGATAVLLGCSRPAANFLDAMARVERDFHLPLGADARGRVEQRMSYLWASRPTPQNIDRYIDIAKRGGFRMILFSYGAFSSGAGHFAWNASYPRGMDDLKAVTTAIRDAGLKLGLHIHYSKAHRTDAYVSPVPDRRLHVVRPFTLAADVSAGATTICVSQNPSGATLDKDRRILRADDELIYYQDYTTEPPFRFSGCQRGYLGTTATDHHEGQAIGLLDVDSWPAFIRFDQTTDIQDEVAERIAEIYQQTGPYELVYFDGAEDVHEPFWYHVALAQQRVFRRLDPPPLVTEAAHYTHFGWHMIMRSNAYDIVAPADGMKDFCRLMPCPTAAAGKRLFPCRFRLAGPIRQWRLRLRRTRRVGIRRQPSGRLGLPHFSEDQPRGTRLESTTR